MIINSGDPRGHMAFVHQEEEEEPVTGEEYCDSDSDDDGVDRYVFLARQPAPAEASDDDDVDDDDDDAMPGGGGGGGGRGRKRRLREILGVASPSAKKARLDPTAPLAPAGTSGSGTTASSPCGARAGDSGSVDAVAARFPEREGVDRKAKNKKRGRCGGDQRAARGKRSKGADCDAGEVSHRDVTAAEAQTTPAAAAAAGASRRFLCSICGRCFGSHQAIGGHVLGHRKKAKSNIAAASCEEYAAGGNGYCSEKTASREEGADGTGGHGEEKTVVAASLGKANGEGNYGGNKTVDVAACHEDVDGSGHGHDKAEKTSAVAASHNQHGNGSKGEDDAIAAIHDRANGDGHNEEIKAIGAANHDDHNGDGDVEEEEVAVAPRHRNANANGTVNKVVAVGSCRNKLTAGNGNGNSIVRKTQHRCEVCGKECPTGQALSGHMRKHRTRPAHGGEGGSARPAPEADGDTQPPPARLIGTEICLE